MLSSENQVENADQRNNCIVLEDEASLITNLWKSEILTELEDSIAYTDVGDDFWMQFSNRLHVSCSGGEASGIPESFSFDHHDALMESMEGHEIAFNVVFLAQHCQFIRSIFFGSSQVEYVEASNRRVRLPLLMYRPLLATLLLLESITKVDILASSSLCWMSLLTAYSILDVASFLQIKLVLDAVSVVVCQKVTVSSLLAAHRQAEIRHVPLADLLWEMVVIDFDLLVCNKKYLELEACQLISLLKEPKLNIKPEEECPLLWDWLQHNKHFDTSVSAKELESALRDAESRASKHLGAGFFDRPRIPQSILMAVGGWGSAGPMNFLDVYEPNRGCWIPVQPNSTVGSLVKNRAYHGVAVNANDLYVLGGYDGNRYHNSIDRLNFNTMEWSTVSPMHERRCYVGSAFVDSNHIIAVGGFDNQVRLGSAEVLDISRNQWNIVAPMHVTRSDGDCVHVDGRSYAIGGFDGLYCHKSCEYYDPQHNSWFPLSRQMKYSRSGVKGVSIGGALMVVGGFTGADRLKEVEFYDPREGLWHPLANMHLKRSNFGIATLGSNVIVCGGYSDSSTTNLGESFDWRNNAWSALPQMISSRSALALGLIERHPMIEQVVNEYDLGLPFEFL